MQSSIDPFVPAKAGTQECTSRSSDRWPWIPASAGMNGVIVASALYLAIAPIASAQSVEDFYKGKPITMLIGGGAGGGYDVYYRALARHMGKHIPGQPTFIPKNQPAASGLAAAAALYTTVDKD